MPVFERMWGFKSPLAHQELSGTNSASSQLFQSIPLTVSEDFQRNCVNGLGASNVPHYLSVITD